MRLKVVRLVAAMAAGFLVQSYSPAVEAKTVKLLAPGGGQVRALIVGINKYSSRSIPSLKGAVADAQDLATTLDSVGVSDLTVLVDDEVSTRQAFAKFRPADPTRRNFEDAMNRLVEVSRNGDLVIISYAGHGSQSPELVKGSEVDGMDETFLLRDFESAGPKTSERIVDNEINHWLLQLQKKKVDALFVADTCHGGGMLRAQDPRAGEVSYRVYAIDMVPQGDKLKPISTIADSKVSADDLPDVTFLAAVNKNSKAPEVSIPGNPTLRGALSYAVARAMSREEDGPVKRQELFGYARQVTYQHSQTKQTIATEPSETAKLDKVVFLRKISVEPAPVPTNAPANDAIRIRVSGAAASSLSGIGAGQFPLKIVAAGEDADLIWDVAKGDALNRYGDVIAKSLKTADLPAIADGIATLRAIAKMSDSGPQNMRLLPSDRRFHAGEVIRFEVDGLKDKFLILVNLSGNGRVRFLFPRLAADEAQVADTTFSLPLRVGEPFGSDHVIAIVSDQRLNEVEAAIRAIDDQLAPGRFASILRSLQQSNRGVRIGMAASFTVP